MVSVKVFPAGYGDCFLIRVDNESRIFNILIDGGLGYTYKDFLKKEFKVLVDNGEKINLLINTHIDADHINGLISFLKDNNKKKYIEIEDVWFNGLEEIGSDLFNENKNKLEKDVRILEKICSRGYEDEFNEREDVSSVGGVSFSSLLEFGKYSRNKIVQGGIITDDLKEVKLADKVKIKIIGPSRDKLDNLESEWLEELAKENFKFTIPKCMELVSSFEYILSRLKTYYESSRQDVSGTTDLKYYMSELDVEDSSVVNDSSISFVLEVENIRMLFLGDAIVRDKDKCKIIENLIEEYGENAKFDLIKLPHHGSRYNISNDFFRLFNANDYIVSSNSEKFGHPDIDVLANLIYINKNTKNIIFNYPVKQYEILNNEFWMEKYKYNIIVGDGKSYIERRY